jgi:hypothetical protein
VPIDVRAAWSKLVGRRYSCGSKSRRGEAYPSPDRPTFQQVVAFFGHRPR